MSHEMVGPMGLDYSPPGKHLCGGDESSPLSFVLGNSTVVKSRESATPLPFWGEGFFRRCDHIVGRVPLTPSDRWIHTVFMP